MTILGEVILLWCPWKRIVQRCNLWPWPLTFYANLVQGWCSASHTPNMNILGEVVLLWCSWKCIVQIYTLWPWPLTFWPHVQIMSKVWWSISQISNMNFLSEVVILWCSFTCLVQRRTQWSYVASIMRKISKYLQFWKFEQGSAYLNFFFDLGHVKVYDRQTDRRPDGRTPGDC